MFGLTTDRNLAKGNLHADRDRCLSIVSKQCMAGSMVGDGCANVLNRCPQNKVVSCRHMVEDQMTSVPQCSQGSGVLENS